MRRLLTIVALALLLLTGCGQREAAKSAEQARQADAAVAGDLIKALSESLDIDGWKARARVWLDLVQQSERSTAVVVAALSPEGPPRVTTTEQGAISNPAQFIAEAQKQVGRTEAENADRAAWQGIAGMLATYAGALASGNLYSVILTAISGAGGAGAIILGAMKTLGALRKRDDALVDAVKTGDLLAEAKTPEEIQTVKDTAAIRQQINGTKPLIEKALSRKA
jgi:hypothetical protein